MPYWFENIRSVSREFSVVLFAEEDMSSLPRPRPPDSLQGRAAAVARRVRHRYVAGTEGHVVVIAPGEEDWATNTFPKCRSHVLMHFIDIDYWSSPVPESSAVAHDVFVIGDMQEFRGTPMD